MITRVNPPHPQEGPVLFALVCAVGLFFVIGGLVTLPIGTEPWLVGGAGLLMIPGGLAFIMGGWLWIQREVTFSDGTIVVRRWIEAMRGKPGRTLPLDDDTRISITLENIQSLRIERNGKAEAVMTLGYWEPPRIRQLIDALRAHGIPFAQYWVGEYPPNVA